VISNRDVQWWISEAHRYPESSPTLIEKLAERLAELDAENERLRGEVIGLRRGRPAGAADGSEVSALQSRVETLQRILNGQASTEPAVVMFSDRLEMARMPLSQVRMRLGSTRSQGALLPTASLGVRCLLMVRPHEDLLLLTSRGRLISVCLHDIPFLIEGNDWPSAGGESRLAGGERVTAAVAAAKSPRFWTLVTRQGFVVQLLGAHVEKRSCQDDPVVRSQHHHDEPVAILDGDRGDLFLITRWGKAIGFPQRAIAGQGCSGLTVEPDDGVVAALPLPADAEVLAITAGGYVMRRDSAGFRRRHKPGGHGRSFIQAYDVLAAVPYAARGKLLFLTYSGKFIAAASAGIPLQGRLGKGMQLCDLSGDPAVAVTFVPGALL